MDGGTIDRRWTLETLSESERESLLVYTKGGQLKMQNNVLFPVVPSFLEIGIE